MFVKKIADCEEIIVADKIILREFLHPEKDGIDVRYSIAYAKVKPGETSSPQKIRTTEVYYILKGSGIMHINGESKEVKEGFAIYVPPCAARYIKNTGNEDLEFVCIVDPAWRPEDEVKLETENQCIFPDSTINDQYIKLVKQIQDKECIIREYLNSKGETDDPVKVKHLEIIIGHLHSILIYLDPFRHEQTFAWMKKDSLISILDQIGKPENILPNNAWELSNLLEIELIRLGNDTYLFTLLKAQKRADNTDPHRWEKHFPTDILETLLDSYICGKFCEGCRRMEARCFLEHLKQAQIEEYRYDRTKIELRREYITVMTVALGVLLIALSSSYYMIANPPFFLLLLVLCAGAVGSVLSNAFKLGKQPLHAENNNKTLVTPLGIRELISQRRIFLAQPVIGATAALILFMIISSGIIQVANKTSEPAVYGITAFLAGFSEVYFIGILDKVAGQTGGTMR